MNRYSMVIKWNQSKATVKVCEKIHIYMNTDNMSNILSNY